MIRDIRSTKRPTVELRCDDDQCDRSISATDRAGALELARREGWMREGVRDFCPSCKRLERNLA